MAITKFKDLRFPDNLGTDTVPNYVSFSPMVMKYGGTKELRAGTNAVGAPGNNTSQTGGLGVPTLANVNVNPGTIINNLASGLDGIRGTAADLATAAQQSANILQNSGSFKDALGNFAGRFAQITNLTMSNAISQALGSAIETSPDSANTAGCISLYLPQNLETNSSVDYETAALGGLGTQAVKVASQIDQQSAISSLASLVVGGMQDAISSGNRRSILGIATGQVTNNFSFQVFNSVLHRQFAYEFRMMPKNNTETEVIKNICDLFLFYMLPARAETGEIGFYEVPCQWKIAYKRKGNSLNFHMQPRNCFLQSVDVGYGGDAGNSTFNDGGPMEVSLRLQFVEIEPLYRAGGYFDDDKRKQNQRATLSDDQQKANTSSPPPGHPEYNRGAR